jgi:YgiT-type zinc finger domain-containing protein
VVERLRALIKAGRYRVTLHAEQERDADQILTSEPGDNLPTGSKIVDQLAEGEGEGEGEVNMKSCPFCKAPLKRKTIEHVHRWGGRLFLFKNIRAEVCSQCGETFLKPAVLRLMDRCTSSGKVGKARISIPVISVPLKVSA